MTLGEKLRSLRSTSSWTQPEFARKLGIEQSYLSKMENDKSIPSTEMFDKLCTAYEVTPDEMLKDLDREYIRQNLMHIPIIANNSNSKHKIAKGKRKAAVIVCSTFILVAVLFFFIANLELLSSNKQYEYRSLGVDFKHEINECLKTNEDRYCYIKFTGEYMPQIYEKTTHNWVSDSIITREYKGESFMVKLDEGFRSYYVKSLKDKRSTANNIFLILAVFLMTLGVLGLIVEARFYSIDKNT
ncbi:helix-turn-helix domain-containing protein [Kangiella koreensis]|uniref:Transcriptional regulator, XRE family n=1 Tax=Kangiella koreensis (strain DSM 16069 / JCM 12317 / KCTC 12182 / SW-125) TaxID=523791 RepID=C7RCB9_KANKD|nr:helix-turn-helix transcriptional regulator [Kangiella koreensis]ACV26911.1 transcriptional regulator, XRE family [Kangiella koreensis DSM 16069]